MNAYELADKLDDSLAFLDAMNTQYKNGFGKYRLLPKEVAAMLRQQADDIEAMQFITECDKKLIKQFEISDKQQAERIAELEKELNMAEEGYALLHKMYFKKVENND